MQRTSATSSLSSCEQSSDLTETNFDASRMGKTYRSRTDDPLTLAQDHRQLQATGHYNGIGGIVAVQRPQLERVRESCGIMMPTLEGKAELSNRSVLQSVFNNGNTITSPTDLGITGNTEPRFNLSLNLNNQRGFVQRTNR